MTEEQNNLLKAIAGGVFRLLCERTTYLRRYESGLPDIVERTTGSDEAAADLLDAMNAVTKSNNPETSEANNE